MSYRDIIKKIQHDAGFSDAESKEALDTMVESLAERLEEHERQKFASQLPIELQDIVLSADMPDRAARHQDIIEEFMEKEDISAEHAKKQVLTAWAALKSFVSEGQIKHLKAQLPLQAAQLLY